MTFRGLGFLAPFLVFRLVQKRFDEGGLDLALAGEGSQDLALGRQGDGVFEARPCQLASPEGAVGVKKSHGLILGEPLDEGLYLRGDAVGLHGETDEHQVVPLGRPGFLEGKDLPGEPDGIVNRPGHFFRVARLRQIRHQYFHGYSPFGGTADSIQRFPEIFKPFSSPFPPRGRRFPSSFQKSR